MRPSGARTTCCVAVVARETTAAGVSDPSTTGQALRDRVEPPRHQHDERVDARGQLLEFGDLSVRTVTGHDRNRTGNTPMRQGNVRGRGSGERCADPGDDAHRDPCRTQRFDLLTASPEEEWVSPFQTNHEMSGSRSLDHQLVDLGLGDGIAARPLADIDAPSSRAAQTKHVGIDERVVQHDVRIGEHGTRRRCDEIGIARTGSCQHDLAHRRLTAGIPATVLDRQRC